MIGWRKNTEMVPSLPPRESHQMEILRRFQECTVARDRAVRLLAHMQEVAAEADTAYSESRRKLRQVSEGSI